MDKRRILPSLSEVAFVVIGAIAIWFVNGMKWDGGTSPNEPYRGQLPLLILIGVAAVLIGNWFRKR